MGACSGAASIAREVKNVCSAPRPMQTRTRRRCRGDKCDSSHAARAWPGGAPSTGTAAGATPRLPNGGQAVAAIVSRPSAKYSPTARTQHGALGAGLHRTNPPGNCPVTSASG